MFFTDEQLIEAIKQFKEESIDLLDGMESALLEIQENGMSNDRINAVFRAAHTLKGSASMLKLEHLVEFTHTAENLLDDIRNGNISITDDMINSFLKCKDHLQNLVMFYASNLNHELDEHTKSLSKLLIDELQTYGAKKQEKEVITLKKVEKESQNSGYDINVIFGEHLFKVGMEPIHFIKFLATLGTIEELNINLDKIERFRDYNPTSCKIEAFIKIKTDATVDTIEDVFEFIRDDITLSIKPWSNIKTDKKVVEVIEHTQPIQRAINQPSDEHQNPIISSTLRVESEKIDTLINLIGEMVIANANVVQKSLELNNDEMIESVQIVSHMLEEIRESAMKIRMVQIGETFNKYKRIVHDISKQLGKDVELIISGGETELDKTLVEKINDPLVHIVRNAMDHGIESVNERVQNGKKPKGRLSLNAFHDAGTIAIEISDDGKGLDEEKILEKAISKGLIEPNTKLSQKDIFNLIFEAGFSTAEQVTNISGRGVGMDVVRRNIQALRGIVDIKSAKDKGSTFTIRLPLTLAIIDGFLIRVGNTYYVIPLEMVIECVELPNNNSEKMSGNDYINLRGSILPILSIREFFGEDLPKESSRDNVVVVRYGEKKFGLIVEELLGEFQTVIKPLGKIFKGVKGIGGSTILGNGQVALILDLPMLIHYLLSNTSQNTSDEVKVS